MLIENANSFAPHTPGPAPADVQGVLNGRPATLTGKHGTITCGEVALTWEVITDPDRFAALHDEWNGLWLRAQAPRVSQQFDWLWTGWTVCAKPRGFGLWVLVVRRNGVAVAGWPLMLRQRGGVRIADTLGSQGTEFDSLLMAADLAEACGAQGQIDALIWDLAARHLPVDLVCAAFVRAGTARDAVLSAAGIARTSETLPSPVVELSGGDRATAWERYWSTRSKSLRKSNERRRRRLTDDAVLETRILTDPIEITQVIDEMLAAKRAWMAARFLQNHFIARPDYRNFLVAMATATPDPGLGHMSVMVLERDGKRVAIKLGTVDRTRYEGFISTYDTAFEHCSPGTLVQLDCFEWCAQNGLDYDTRIGAEAYKAQWATRDDPATTHWLALTIKGALYLAARERLRQWRETRGQLRAAVPERWRQWLRPVKTLLRPESD